MTVKNAFPRMGASQMTDSIAVPIMHMMMRHHLARHLAHLQRQLSKLHAYTSAFLQLPTSGTEHAEDAAVGHDRVGQNGAGCH